MKYEIYCDESCVEGLFDKQAHPYAVIGGIWIPAEFRPTLKKEINNLKSKYNKNGEMKWNKIAPSSLAFYREVIDLFFRTYQIRFRAICVETQKVNHTVFNQGNGELGFYKFYFQLIHNWLITDNEYCLFLDHKINGYPHRVNDLKKILQYSTNANILQAQALPSEQSVLIQLADVLTGAVAASFNDELHDGSAKKEICSTIEAYIGHQIRSTAASEQKFNVFDINLRQGW